MDTNDPMLGRRKRGALPEFNGHAQITGPCGDTMSIWLNVQGGKIVHASFDTNGCWPSIASGSGAVDFVVGKHVKMAEGISHHDILKVTGKLPEESAHCALLAANTVKAACSNHLENCSLCSPREKHLRDEEHAIAERMSRIRHKIVVLSGKGGVGKSTIAVNLALALAMAGRRVGLLDVDIHGPSVPTMLGLEGAMIGEEDGEIIPLMAAQVKVISIGLFLRDHDDAVIWRGPLKMNVIRQFLKDVAWGELDFLIVDSPPGTGDEPLSVCQLIGHLDGAVIVTTPQRVSEVDVRKSISFCQQLNVPVLGLVENMNGFACPDCGRITAIFPSGAGQRMADDLHVPFLGSIPMDPGIAEACDRGQAFIQHKANSCSAQSMRNVIAPILNLHQSVPATGNHLI